MFECDELSLYAGDDISITDKIKLGSLAKKVILVPYILLQVWERI